MTNVKVIADSLNIKYHPNTGEQTIIERIKEHCKQNDLDVSQFLDLQELEKSANQSKTIDLSKFKPLTDPLRHKKLVRCEINCNNPDKSAQSGETITVGNARTHERKHILYDKPYMVPQMIFNVLKEKEYSRFQTVTKRSDTGIAYKTSKRSAAREFNITELGAIPNQELEAIKKRQLLDAGE